MQASWKYEHIEDWLKSTSSKASQCGSRHVVRKFFTIPFRLLENASLVKHIPVNGGKRSVVVERVALRNF